MKKLIAMVIVNTLSLSAFAYSEQDCLKDTKKALQQSGLTSVYLKALKDVENKSETAQGMYLGIQDASDMAIQNALKTYCKLQEKTLMF